MEWYYAEDGRQCGPVSTEQLEGLVRSGKLLPTGLVWRAGMPEWQTYVSTQPAAPPGLAAGDTGRCAECGQTVSRNDLLRYENSWICARCKPIFFQRLREGAAPPASLLIWRSDRLLVMSQGAELPDRCVKCNAPAHGQRLRRKLYWHSPYIYLLILLNLLIYVIVAMIVRKRAQVEVGLCEPHRSQRRLAIGLGWLMGLGGLALFILSLVNNWGWFALLGFVLFITGLVWGAAKGPVISAKKIDPQFVWVKGVCRDYLATLPEWRDGV